MNGIKVIGILFSICSLVEIGYLNIISNKYKDKNVLFINLIKIIIVLLCITFVRINAIIFILFFYQIYISLKHFDELFSELIIKSIDVMRK